MALSKIVAGWQLADLLQVDISEGLALSPDAPGCAGGYSNADEAIEGLKKRFGATSLEVSRSLEHVARGYDPGEFVTEVIPPAGNQPERKVRRRRRPEDIHAQRHHATGVTPTIYDR